jgi:lysophospholipase
MSGLQVDRLVSPPQGAPLPQGGVMACLHAADGLAIRAAFWPAKAGIASRGTVLLLQGRAEFIEKYAETIARLTLIGFHVASFDWRGQGGSTRQLRNPRKGHVEDFEDYQLDLEAAIRAMRDREMPQPWLLLSHSMGGAIALGALARGSSPFRRAVLCAPLVKVANLWSEGAARVLARGLAGLGFSAAFVPGGSGTSVSEEPFADNKLTQDAARYAHAQALLQAEPALAIGDPTIGWVDAMFAHLQAFDAPDFGAAITTPILMLLAGVDRVVDTPAAARLAARLRGASAIEIPAARHEIMMERDDLQHLFWRGAEAFFGLQP